MKLQRTLPLLLLLALLAGCGTSSLSLIHI